MWVLLLLWQAFFRLSYLLGLFKLYTSDFPFVCTLWQIWGVDWNTWFSSFQNTSPLAFYRQPFLSPGLGCCHFIFLYYSLSFLDAGKCACLTAGTSTFDIFKLILYRSAPMEGFWEQQCSHDPRWGDPRPKMLEAYSHQRLTGISSLLWTHGSEQTRSSRLRLRWTSENGGKVEN